VALSRMTAARSRSRVGSPLPSEEVDLLYVTASVTPPPLPSGRLGGRPAVACLLTSKQLAGPTDGSEGQRGARHLLPLGA
jgi:hypothetical protein